GRRGTWRAGAGAHAGAVERHGDSDRHDGGLGDILGAGAGAGGGGLGGDEPGAVGGGRGSQRVRVRGVHGAGHDAAAQRRREGVPGPGVSAAARAAAVCVQPGVAGDQQPQRAGGGRGGDGHVRAVRGDGAAGRARGVGAARNRRGRGGVLRVCARVLRARGDPAADGADAGQGAGAGADRGGGVWLGAARGHARVWRRVCGHVGASARVRVGAVQGVFRVLGVHGAQLLDRRAAQPRAHAAARGAGRAGGHGHAVRADQRRVLCGAGRRGRARRRHRRGRRVLRPRAGPAVWPARGAAAGGAGHAGQRAVRHVLGVARGVQRRARGLPARRRRAGRRQPLPVAAGRAGADLRAHRAVHRHAARRRGLRLPGRHRRISAVAVLRAGRGRPAGHAPHARRPAAPVSRLARGQRGHAGHGGLHVRGAVCAAREPGRPHP
ncbi:hypothetical protein LPJ70_006663, partial [Coemansia sp. RSA 2708]